MWRMIENANNDSKGTDKQSGNSTID